MNLDFSYPNTPTDIVCSIGILFIFVAIATRSAFIRGLPLHIGLLGLIPITGCVYVASIDSRKEDALEFKQRLVKRFKRFSVLTGLLTFLMYLYAFIGTLLLIGLLLSFGIPSSVTINGVETESALLKLTGVPVCLAIIFTGFFHLKCTRPSVISITKGRTANKPNRCWSQ